MNLESLTEFFTGRGWVLGVFATVFVTLILNVIVVAGLRRLKRRLALTNTIWKDTLVAAVTKPVGWLIWLFGFVFAAQLVSDHQDGGFILEHIDTIQSIAMIVIFVWFVLRFIGNIEQRVLDRQHPKKVDKTSLRAICQLIRAAVVVTGILVALPVFGISITGFVAFGGVGTLVIGLAGKDLLANFFGGFMIFLDRPFKIGDWIRSPDKQIEGTVEYIGWRLTRIRTFDKRPLYVPNSFFSTIAVENPSRMLNRRIYTNVGLRYDDAAKVGTILRDIEKMLKEHPEIDTDQTLMVNLVEFGASSLNFMIYTFTKTTDWVKFQAIQEDVFLKVIDVITAHGAECAFPTTTLHIPGGVSVK